MSHLFIYCDEEQYNLALEAIKEIGVDYEVDEDDLSIQTDDLSDDEIDIMNSARDPVQFRVEKVYRRLVDETESETTARDRSRANLLSKLLDIVEYLRGNGEDPLPDWFD